VLGYSKTGTPVVCELMLAIARALRLAGHKAKSADLAPSEQTAVVPYLSTALRMADECCARILQK